MRSVNRANAERGARHSAALRNATVRTPHAYTPQRHSSRVVAAVRSSTRLPEYGPRSMTRACVQRPERQIRSRVPHGRLRCATPRVEGRSVCPQAVRFPYRPGPYALACPRCHVAAAAGVAVNASHTSAARITRATATRPGASPSKAEWLRGEWRRESSMPPSFQRRQIQSCNESSAAYRHPARRL